MHLKEIYQPIENELRIVTNDLESFLGGSDVNSILEINQFLLKNPGKRLRPAMVLLSAKATSGKDLFPNAKLTNIASAIEMIHLASLVHDDVMDHALIRHNKPSVNHKWGADVSVALGDYLYSKAFEIISSHGDIDILYCISQATSMMCEGELAQVCIRGNVSLMKKQYLSIIEKKTASLFAASCKVGAMISNSRELIQSKMNEYGVNFGIAFQVIDDCIDLVGEMADLGKSPGADFKMGELTLPIINLLSQTDDKKELLSLINQPNNQSAFQEIKQRFMNSEALNRTKEEISTYIQRARKCLSDLKESIFRQSLLSLAELMAERASL